MFRNVRIRSVVTLAIAISLGACEQTATSPQFEGEVMFAKGGSRGRGGTDSGQIEALVRQVDAFNAMLAEAGQTIRLDYPWMFVVGQGTDPFQSLRTGSRWSITDPEYVLDESDFTNDIAAGDVEATLVSAFDSWNDVPESHLEAVRVADNGENFDILDGSFDDGVCVDIFDPTSSIFDPATGQIFPVADIVMGGWAPENYFSECLGSSNIIGVTWTFSGPDTDGDQYDDRLYVEQFYNPAFSWVTSGSVFLDFSTGVDLQTIAAHENGHAHGLGHFGGPVRSQPFTLKRTGRVFNPEAVMNPFYLGGEKRLPRTTDVAGLLTMYGAVR